MPVIRNLTVVQGAMITSSWSLPLMSAPLRLRMPATFIPTFLTRISFPIGDSSPNNCRTTVWPIMQTEVRLRTADILIGEEIALGKIPFPDRKKIGGGAEEAVY